MSSPPARVLISDEVSAKAIDRFAAERDVEVDYRPDIAAADLPAVIPPYAALVVRSRTRVTAEVIAAAGRLQIIGRAGTGVDNVDLDAATSRGIVVMNVPGGNTISAAEHTMGMILSLARGIPAADRSMRAGAWERGRFVGTELQGKTLGVLGMGRIGREVVQRARSFGMIVIAHDPFVSGEEIDRAKIDAVPLDELLRRSDVITIHAPLTPETRHMLGDAQIAACKPGVRIVNCARGGLVDEGALARALRSGHVAGAALDVFEHEPPEHLPLGGLDNVVLTPHLAASTTEAQEKVALIIADQICDYLRDGVARNAVNVTSMDPRLRERLAPYIRLAETLGRFQAQTLDGRLSRVTVEYSGEIPPEALPSLTVGVLRGYFERFLSGPVNAVNAAWIARDRGIRLDEVRTSEPQDYMNLVTAVFDSECGRREVAGTVFGRNLPRIVRLDGFRFDAVPEGNLVLVSNDDRPGIVGMVGSLLGRHQVNIASMSLGRDRLGGHAIAVIHLDSPLHSDLLAEMRALPGILWVRTVSL